MIQLENIFNTETYTELMGTLNGEAFSHSFYNASLNRRQIDILIPLRLDFIQSVNCSDFYSDSFFRDCYLTLKGSGLFSSTLLLDEVESYVSYNVS